MGQWVWNAPRQPGVRELIVRRTTDGASITLRVVVMVPADRVRGGVLNGYEIGDYPPAAGRALVYAPPGGFIEVRRGSVLTRLSPFRARTIPLRLDRCLSEIHGVARALVLKLEALLERVNELGHEARSFAIVSGYRTPAFNESIGGTPHSRHIYGGAAGIIINRSPRDGLMDDLDGDGQVGNGDAEVLFAIAEELFQEPGYAHLRGGLSVYKSAPWRGPYLHVDARGYRARWDSDLDEQRLPQPIEPRHLRDFPPPGRLARIDTR